MKILRNNERMHTKWDWLESYHSFSFGEHHNPELIHFGPLRVINDDYVAGGGGFPTHPHNNMEIITYVTHGALEHRDSMGNSEVIRANEVQKMTAGTGIYHSEFNHHPELPVHLFQIWIFPDKKGYAPSYEQMKFPRETRTNNLCLVVSPDHADGVVHVKQDVRMYISFLQEGKTLSHNNPGGRGMYLHVAEGGVLINGNALAAGDAVMAHESGPYQITAEKDSELLLFDVVYYSLS